MARQQLAAPSCNDRSFRLARCGCRYMSSNKIDIHKDVSESVAFAGNNNNVVVNFGPRSLSGTPTEPADNVLLVPPEEVGPNPYQGLTAFDETTSYLFFGREKITDRIVCKLATHWHGHGDRTSPPRLLAIMGPSGCGKSSIARAGVASRVKQGHAPALENAEVSTFKPGRHPLHALSVVLARIATGDPAPAAKADEFQNVLRRPGTSGFFDGLARLARVLPDERRPLILLVDQFEETWTRCRPDDENNEAEKERARAERLAFVSALMYAASELNGRVIVLLTLRSDFFGATAEVPAVNQAIAQSNEIVPVMSRDELGDAIAKPAEVAGHALDGETITRLLHEVEGQDSSLPLLQFALYRIWEGFRTGQSGSDTLNASGGVGGALASRAEKLFQEVSDEGRQSLVRRAFEEMVQLGEGTRYTRRRVPLRYTIPQGMTEDEATAALEPFVQERLISKGMDENEQVVLELAHEALIQHWRTLKEWIEERRPDVPFGRRVQEAVTLWWDHDRPSGRLWRTPDLEFLIEYARRYPRDMTNEAAEFLRQSQQKKVVLGRIAYSTVGVICGLLLVVMILAFYSWRTASAALRESTQLTAINRFLKEDLLRAGDPTVPGSIADPPFRYILARAAQRLQSDATQPPMIRASIELTFGQTYVGLGDYKTAEQHLRLAIEAAAHDDQANSLQAEAEYTLVKVLLNVSRLPEAKDLLSQADRDAGAELSKPTPLAVLAHLAHGAYEDDLDLKPEVALTEFETANDIRRLSAPDDVVLLFETGHELIDAYIAAGRFEKARAVATPLMAQSLSIDRVGIENWARVRESFAEILSHDHNYSNAIATDQGALTALRAQLGEQHFYFGVALSELANVYVDADTLDAALTTMTQAYEIMKRVPGEGSQNALGARANVDVIQLEMGGSDDFIVDLTETRNRFAKLVGSDNPQVQFFNYELAQNLSDRGRAAEAWTIASSLSAAALAKTGNGGEDWPERLQALRGKILLREGHRSEALSLLAPALAKMEADHLSLEVLTPFRKALAEARQ